MMQFHKHTAHTNISSQCTRMAPSSLFLKSSGLVLGLCMLCTLVFLSTPALGASSPQQPVKQIYRGQHVVELDAFTFYPSISDGGLWFVEFFTHDCRGCKRMATTWSELAESLQDHTDIHVARLDCEAWEQLCDQVSVDRTPTLKLFFQGAEVLHYKADVIHIDLLRPFILKQHAKLLGHASGTGAAN